MKKNLKISGKVLFERADIIKMITEVLQATEDLQLERIVPVDENGEAVKVDSFICYVHQTKSDEIPDKYDPAKAREVKKGFERPNRGLSKALKEIFASEGVLQIDYILSELKEQFPRLTKKQLRLYLTRSEMTGCKLEIDGNDYWNPNASALK